MTLTPESLTRDQVLSILKSANCCATKKISQYIGGMSEGRDCEKLFDDAELMFNLLDSIRCFVPEGDTIAGDQACFQITIGGGNLNVSIDITIGSITYPTLVIPSSPAVSAVVIADALAAYINSFYPQNYPYTASSILVLGVATVEVCGTDYELSNGTVVSGVLHKNAGDTPFSGSLAGGAEQVLQGKNQITNEEAITILNKITSLCCAGC